MSFFSGLFKLNPGGGPCKHFSITAYVVGQDLNVNCPMQVSLPLLAPLLLGTGMMLRGIRSNASIIFPRMCVMVVLLYVLWFFNSVVQNTVVYLRRQVYITPVFKDSCCFPSVDRLEPASRLYVMSARNHSKD